MTETKYVVQKFEKALHDRGAFSCGIPEMDKWFKTSISQQIKDYRVRVWCAVDTEKKVVGFYALNAHAIEPSEATALAKKSDRNPIPVIYLVAIATDVTARGANLGSALMGHALEKALSISKELGTAAVVLDVLEDENFQRRKDFYERLGFAKIDPENEKRFFLSMKDIAAEFVATA
ncbi:GNAT family N-acetyltransferase [Aliiroseovarius lamellibrachiae]|uniref:GNAT family N-acetyltransferase n=1 Tax=Aliiroseovarius lamellibrachiae TaxID=1924933 RepID=UPI001BE12934|nr:GNAT family N-acetyltransferase [Aliiroseovarius lamellibrachiae]MBT2132310.1 GNAT family N-acetyltransferase [Aliiroseovarius lamellibrachiae]